MKLPAMPPMPRARSGKPRARSKKSAIPTDLNREVMWREGEEEVGQLQHVYGTCAKCGIRRQAIDLVWRPDRLIFGELHLGFWACKDGCEEEGDNDVQQV